MSARRFPVGPEEAGLRLDVVLARRLPALSRSALCRRVREGAVTVDGSVARRPAARLKGGESIELSIPEAPPAALEAEDIPLAILYEDDDLLVVDKPAGLVVHPAAGHRRGTLVNALLGRGLSLAAGGAAARPGIVHRLDKDTSGCLLVAKNERARERLLEQFRSRSVGKTYLALVRGRPPLRGRIDAAIGRSTGDRKKMSVRSRGGREARTSYRTLERFHGLSLLEVTIETGRTHQIRVHLASLGHPVLGDTVYGGRGHPRRLPRAPRQMLHAAAIRFVQPSSGREIEVRAPEPEDLARLLGELRGQRRSGVTGDPA